MSLSYEEEIALLADKRTYTFPLLIDSYGRQVAVLLVLDKKAHARRMGKIILEKLRCNTCHERVKRFCGYVNGMGDPILFSRNRMPQCQFSPAFYEPLLVEQEAILADTRILGLHILLGETLDGIPEHEGDFSHYYIQIPDIARSQIDARTAALYEKAILRYCPEELPTMLQKMIPSLDQVADMRASLELMNSLLPEVPYGNKLEHSVAWLLRVVNAVEEKKTSPIAMSPARRWIFCARILLWTAISPDGETNAVSPIIQQARGSVLSILEVARNRSAMVVMLQERLSPLNYRRPSTTKMITSGAIDNGIRILGDFSNQIMSQAMAAKLKGAYALAPHRDTGALLCMQNMKKTASIIHKKKTPYSFAQRAQAITSITQLAERIACPDSVIQTLEVCTTGHSPCYLAETTLDPSRLSVPYLWSFLHNKSIDLFRRNTQTGFEPVSLLIMKRLPRYKQAHWIFRDPLLSEEHLRHQNCCFPEFLSTQYTRQCRDVFEHLNKTLPLQTPPAGTPAALGIGSCVKDHSDTLTRPIRIRINGAEEHVLSRF